MIVKINNKKNNNEKIRLFLDKLTVLIEEIKSFTELLFMATTLLALPFMVHIGTLIVILDLCLKAIGFTQKFMQ